MPGNLENSQHRKEQRPHFKRFTRAQYHAYFLSFSKTAQAHHIHTLNWRKRLLLLPAFLLFLFLRPCNASPSPDADAVASASASASAAPERSLVDSGYSRTANYIMKTAMKLPPHILPTLDEIASSTTSTTERNPAAPKEEFRSLFLIKKWEKCV